MADSTNYYWHQLREFDTPGLVKTNPGDWQFATALGWDGSYFYGLSGADGNNQSVDDIYSLYRYDWTTGDETVLLDSVTAESLAGTGNTIVTDFSSSIMVGRELFFVAYINDAAGNNAMMALDVDTLGTRIEFQTTRPSYTGDRQWIDTAIRLSDGRWAISANNDKLLLYNSDGSEAASFTAGVGQDISIWDFGSSGSVLGWFLQHEFYDLTYGRNVLWATVRQTAGSGTFGYRGWIAEINLDDYTVQWTSTSAFFAGYPSSSGGVYAGTLIDFGATYGLNLHTWGPQLTVVDPDTGFSSVPIPPAPLSGISDHGENPFPAWFDSGTERSPSRSLVLVRPAAGSPEGLTVSIHTKNGKTGIYMVSAPVGTRMKVGRISMNRS